MITVVWRIFSTEHPDKGTSLTRYVPGRNGLTAEIVPHLERAERTDTVDNCPEKDKLKDRIGEPVVVGGPMVVMSKPPLAQSLHKNRRDAKSFIP